MNLADERLRELDNPSLSVNERLLLRCSVAADLTHKGQYEAAHQALGELWRGIGQRPEVRGMPPATAAEVLLRCGTLTGYLGGAMNIAGAQEQAKDLLSEAVRKFQSQGQHQRASEAQSELGACYWRLGAHDDARVMMREALKNLTDADVELKAKILIRSTLVEISESRYYEALNILKEAEPVFEAGGDAIKGRWHGQKGLILRKLATAEGRTENFDKAIIEYTAAIYHYELAKHERYCALNLNNLAFLLHKLGRYQEAHEQLDRAQRIYTRLKDAGSLAQVNETRARVLIAEHRYREANRVIAEVIKSFEKSGKSALLADALIVQGIAWARLGAYDSSMKVLRRAISTAEESGALVNSALARLTLVEEHGAKRLSQMEVFHLYWRADELLKSTQDAEDIKRLRACARIALRRLLGMCLHDKGFTLYRAVHEYEAKFIEQALEEAEGSVTRAAMLLGIRHQSLSLMLKQRHKRLLPKRKPAQRRFKSIIKKPKK